MRVAPHEFEIFKFEAVNVSDGGIKSHGSQLVGHNISKGKYIAARL
jgi:hypothetical protein